MTSDLCEISYYMIPTSVVLIILKIIREYLLPTLISSPNSPKCTSSGDASYQEIQTRSLSLAFGHVSSFVRSFARSFNYILYLRWRRLHLGRCVPWQYIKAEQCPL